MEIFEKPSWALPEEQEAIPPIKKIAPAKNPTERKTFEENLEKFLETEKTAPDKEGTKQKSQEELKKEKNEVEGKGGNLDITT